MLFERLEELNVFLALLFNSKLTLPSVSTLKDVICNNVMKKKSNATVQSFIEFVDNIEKYFSDIKIASSSCYSAFLSDAELNSDNDDACIHFFNMILDDEYLPSEEDIQLLTSRIFYIVRHDSIDVCRVEEVFQMLREAKYICESISSTMLYIPSYDEYPCDCFEYDMSGHCSHSLDDDVFS